MNTKIIFIDGIKTNYTIDENGIVTNYITNRILKGIFDIYGYLHVNLYFKDKNNKKMMKSLKIHRLVALAFIPNEKLLPTVNHKDGIKTNNNVNNLEWMSVKDNNIHAILNGLNKGAYNNNSKKGTDHWNCKCKEDEVKLIISYLKEGKYTCTEISNLLDISREVIYDIKYHRSWKYLTKDLIFPNNKKLKYPKKLKKKIKKLIQLSFSNKEIYKLLNIEINNSTRDIIKKIRKKVKKENSFMFNDHELIKIRLNKINVDIEI